MRELFIVGVVFEGEEIQRIKWEGAMHRLRRLRFAKGNARATPASEAYYRNSDDLPLRPAMTE
jgi:hypothetical protein